MARLTKAQRDAVADLSGMYGAPDRVFIENTEEDTGPVWMRWHLVESALGAFKDRNLFIHPDGTRLFWTTNF